MTATDRRKVVFSRPSMGTPGLWQCKLSCGHWVYLPGRSKNGQPPTAPYTSQCPYCKPVTP